MQQRIWQYIQIDVVSVKGNQQNQRLKVRDSHKKTGGTHASPKITLATTGTDQLKPIGVPSMARIVVSFGVIIAYAVCMVPPAAGQPITAELAKKCRALAIRAHPTPPTGSKPAGTEKLQRDFFRECVSKNGNIEK